MSISRRAHRHWASKIIWTTVALVWVSAVVAGTVALQRFSFRPGAAGHPASHWPAQSRLPHPSDADNRMTLVVALHAGCACSRATVEELNKLCAERPDSLHLHALFVNKPPEAESSELWRTLQRLPGVSLAADPLGTEARRFDLQTSGEVRLYGGADHRLRFHGGVTLSRGHTGANPGSAAIIAAIDSSRSNTMVTTPVFGCALFDPTVAETASP
jgi:hypothetical protein